MSQSDNVYFFQYLFLALALCIHSAVGAVGAVDAVGAVGAVGSPYVKPNTFTTSITTISTTLVAASASNSLGAVTLTTKPTATCINTPRARGNSCITDDPKSAAIGIGVAAGAFILLLIVTLIVTKLRRRTLRRRNANPTSLAADNISLDAPPPPYTKSGPNSLEMHTLSASRAASPPPPEFTVEVPHHEERDKDVRS